MTFEEEMQGRIDKLNYYLKNYTFVPKDSSPNRVKTEVWGVNYTYRYNRWRNRVFVTKWVSGWTDGSKL